MPGTSAHRILASVLLAALTWLPLQSADTLRICTYNVLNYSLNTDNGRTEHFQRILEAIKPDILVCSEVTAGNMATHFVSNVLTWGPFSATPFVDGPDSDNQLFYNNTKVRFISQRAIPTALRNIAEYTLERIPAPGFLPDTIVVYSMHLKANRDEEAAGRRAAEVEVFQSTVTHNRYAMVCGDLNIYSPTERAYQLLANPEQGRVFVDPLGSDWQRDRSTYSWIYTQSTRMQNPQGCTVGSTGGMDDRFDYIFLSSELSEHLVPNSYTAFGNDSVSRLNSSIYEPENTTYGNSMAYSLMCVSDHLPVYVDLAFDDTPAGVSIPTAVRLQISYSPNAEAVTITNCTPRIPITVVNINGQRMISTMPVNNVCILSTGAWPKGTYIVYQGSDHVKFSK